MKSPTAFMQVLIHEMGEWCSLSTTRDCKTISSRVEDEGLSFLTITLPSFGKDLQKGLEQGKVDRDLFQGFSWRGGLPRFLGGFLDQIFDRSTGCILDAPSVEAIRAVHQITSAYGKVELECTRARQLSALTRYVECEQEVRTADASRSPDDVRSFERTALRVFGELFQELEHTLLFRDLVPRHGPGATADGLRGNAKWRQAEWPRRLEQYFPAVDMLVPSYRYWQELESVDFLEPGRERPVKVVLVPKTMKTPRVIAEEPTCMQYAQQALKRLLYEGIEGSDALSSFIGFTDQIPNQDLAREGSLYGELATLDLSEASDRVSNQLVRSLFKYYPTLSGAVQACRSRKADVLGKTIRLAKFSSMGSALCFPVEAMVFLTIILDTIAAESMQQVTPSFLKSLEGKVRVYGDDIIVPSTYAAAVSERLEAFGLRVNLGKSFWNGRFRESCGGDFFAGVRITPVRVRSMFPSNSKQVREVISTVSLRNQLYQAGFSKTVEWLDDGIASILRYYPEVEPSSPVLGRHTISPFGEKLCSRLQIPLVKGYVVKSILPVSQLDGPSALLKWFLHEGHEPLAADHLIRAGRPVSVDIKTRWASIR